MASTAPTIVRVPRAMEWRALDGDLEVGHGYATPRPDQRWFVSFDCWQADGYERLLAAMVGDVRQDLYMTVNESDYEMLDRCAGLGFTVHREEDEYLVPTDPAVTGLADARLPAGFHIVSAADADRDALRALDELLRQDVPGSDGWVNDPQEFREYTFAAWHFDPAAYLVAVDTGTGEQAGLVRVWKEPRIRRLGLIGVVAAHRRRGVALALLAAAFGPLHEHGVAKVVADVDVTNTASASLLRRLGARRIGGSVELIRRYRSGA